jgi:hypothetical protein
MTLNRVTGRLADPGLRSGQQAAAFSLRASGNAREQLIERPLLGR